MINSFTSEVRVYRGGRREERKNNWRNCVKICKGIFMRLIFFVPLQYIQDASRMKVIHLPTAKGAIAHSRRVTALKGTHAGCDHPMQLAAKILTHIQAHGSIYSYDVIVGVLAKAEQSRTHPAGLQAEAGTLARSLLILFT